MVIVVVLVKKVVMIDSGDYGDGIDGDGDGVFVSSTLSQIMVFKFEGAAVEEELGWGDKNCVIGAINGNCVMMALLQTLPTASLQAQV